MIRVNSHLTIATIACLVYLVSGFLAAGETTANATDDKVAATQSRKAGQDSASEDWLDKYLSEEMQYDEQQVKQFKNNVANMSDEDMRAMLRRMKQQRQFREIQREIVFDAQQSNFNRSQEARAMAYSHPAHSSYYKYNERIRTINRSPGRQSLFRGYFVGIRVR